MASACARPCRATARQEPELKWLDVSVSKYFLQCYKDGPCRHTSRLSGARECWRYQLLAIERCRNGLRHGRFRYWNAYDFFVWNIHPRSLFIPDRVVIRLLLHRYCSENILYKKSIDVLSDHEKENAILRRDCRCQKGLLLCIASSSRTNTDLRRNGNEDNQHDNSRVSSPREPS